jgi:hypothetical protein
MNNIKITFISKDKKEKLEKVEEINLIQKEKYFEEIGKIAKLHKKKQRMIKVADLDNPRLILYHTGQYKYYSETEKRYKYITEKVPETVGKMRHNLPTIIKAIEPVLRNEMTINYASQQGRDLLNLTTVPSTIWRWIGMIDIDEKSYQAMEEKVIETHSGHISVDEVYDKGDGIIFITDPVKDTIVSHKMLEGKPTLKDIEGEFKKIHDKNVEIISCTKDGSPLYVNSIKMVFVLVLVQICIFHLIKNLNKCFMKWHKELRKQIKNSKLPRGIKTQGRKLKQFVYQTRYLFMKKELSEKEKKIVDSIIESYPDFGELRRLYLKFIRLFESDDIVKATKRFWDFMAEPLVAEKMPDVHKQLMYHFERKELFTYLLFDESIRKKIRTTNHTERVNRKLRKKQKTHYRIRKTIRREKMLRFMVYFHNMKALGMDSQMIILFFFFVLSQYQFYKLTRFGIQDHRKV